MKIQSVSSLLPMKNAIKLPEEKKQSTSMHLSKQYDHVVHLLNIKFSVQTLWNYHYDFLSIYVL